MKDTTYSDSTQWLIEHYDSNPPRHPSPSQMAADVAKKYRQLESTRLAALQEGDSAAYYKARAQQEHSKIFLLTYSKSGIYPWRMPE